MNGDLTALTKAWEFRTMVEYRWQLRVYIAVVEIIIFHLVF